jgi:hypothetical protein
MAEQQTRAIILNGTPYIGGEDIGNTSKLSVSCAFTELSLRNYRGGGGNDACMKRLDSISLALDARNVSLKVLEAALGGVATMESRGALIPGESHPVSPECLGRLIPTRRLQDMGATLAVTHSESGELVPLDANGEGDFRRAHRAIIRAYMSFHHTALFNPKKTAFANARRWKGGHSKAAEWQNCPRHLARATRIQAMLRQGFESDLFFDGQNEVTGGKWIGRFYRVHWSPTESVDLIGEDFAAFSISGEVLADETRNGTTESRFYELAIGEAFI